MKLEITGKEMLGHITERLGHLVECRAFLDEVVQRGLDAKLIAEQAKDQYEHNRTRLKDELLKYRALCRDHALNEEINSNRSPVVKLLEDIEELDAVEDLVKYHISEASGGPYGNGLPRELNNRLRDLTGFDDSE